MAAHYVIIKGKTGKPSQFRLKQWVRENIAFVPQGINPDIQTSHVVREQLINNGWRMKITNNEVLLIKPDENGHFNYIEELLTDIETEEETDTIETEQAIEITFSLEKDLQAALRRNINSLEQGLTIIDGGKERNTLAGRIDITAKDNDNNTVIIELKAVDAKPEVIAQVLAYMEAVRAEDNTEVRGIIIASGFSDRVKLAARQVTNLELLIYSFQFNYNLVE